MPVGPAAPNYISRCLAKKGWTDSELAERCRIDRARINRIKNRHVEPTAREALTIARVLELSVGSVFPEAGRS